MKKILKILLIILLVVVILFVAYRLYEHIYAMSIYKQIVSTALE